MKALRTIALITLATFLGTSVYAQDDFYPSSKKKSKKSDEANFLEQEQETLNDADYSTATDYYYDQREREIQEEYNRQLGITDSTTYYEDENGNVRITNNYYNGDNYDFDNEYYDYEYTSRIRRFHRPAGRYGYYDDYYTNYYYYNYDPYYYGTSIYVSYGWWYPSPWRWNVGWGWGGGYYGGGWGWNYGWGYGWGSPWHWGYGGGWYGSSYWSGYNHGYMNGYYDGLYASGNYYNSYDRNSHYYGKRGSTGGSDGYGGTRATTVNTSGKSLTFGEKYEQAVKSNPGLNTVPKSGISNTPKNNAGTTVKGNVNTPVKQNTYGTAPKTNHKPTGTNPKPYTSPTKTYGGNTPKPSMTPTKTQEPYNKPYTAPTKPQTSPKPYTPPTRTNTAPTKTNTPKSYPKPSYTPQPKSNNRPSYSKPSPKQNYNPPKSNSRPSYSPPSRSGGSYNSGGGSRSGGSFGGSRKSPR